MSQKIKCEICGKYYKQIFCGHLSNKHGISAKEYQQRFPGAPLQSDEVSRKRSASATRVNTGRKLSSETKKKMANSVVRFYGDIAGTTPVNGGPPRCWYRKYNNPKKQALERDKYKCQGNDCKKTSNRLEVHHKDGNTSNNDLSNLITLCRSCHAREHGQTFSNETREKGKAKRIARLRSPEIRQKMSESVRRAKRKKTANDTQK